MILAALIVLTGAAIHLSRQPALAIDWASQLALPEGLPPFSATTPHFCTNELCLAVQPSVETAAEHCPKCGSLLADRSLGEMRILPKDTRMWKRLYRRGEMERYFTTLVLGGGAKESIHRPELCLVAQGYSIRDERVEKIDLPDGHSLEVKVLQIVAPSADNAKALGATSIYAYWLFQSDRETPHHTTRMLLSIQDGILRNTWTPWAYIAIHTAETRNPEQLTISLKAFIQQLYPRVLATLPPTGNETQLLTRHPQ
ncbi:MAG: exosortase-associated EpsI family protein [Verrucomicrobia bacterium]|nr:exosortase-associated EpsI family protein [Verrucomicrobiota bacterium]